MRRVGWPLRRISFGGRSAGGGAARRHRAATAAAVAALIAVVGITAGCETVTTSVQTPSLLARAHANVAAGLDLYEAAEFAVAADRFHSAAAQARAARDRTLEKKAVTAECTARLRARALADLAECTSRLERLQRRARRSEPGVNTLVALGAIAGQRPLPTLRIPNTVQSLVQAAAVESSR